MKLVFDALEIEPCSNCACDWLAYSNSESNLPTTLKNYYYKICAFYSKNAIAILKETNKYSKILFFLWLSERGFWLQFRSDGSSEFKGFKGKITVMNTRGSSYCLDSNNIINETSGSISSPKYPLVYLPNQEMTWCLVVPKGYRVKLTFKAFDLENTRTSDNDCSKDYVEIRDGKLGSDGELLGRFCGNTIPGEIFSLSNQMYVLFVSDSNTTSVYKGFKANFEMDGNHGNHRSHAPSHAGCPKDAVKVAATLKPGWKYEIQSPGFPSNYELNQTCTWKVFFPDSMGKLRSSYRMMLVFDALEIEPCTGCACDWLAYNYIKSYLPTSSYKKCGLYSKNAIAKLKEKVSSKIPIDSDYNEELRLQFHSDGSSEFKGFKGKITVVNGLGSSCLDSNNIINETSGTISSPKYPLKYMPNQFMTWCLIVPKGSRVKLTFKAFDLDHGRTSDNDCNNDYVEIRDGKLGRAGELLGRFCGNTIPGEIFSISNQMYVLFVSDYNPKTVYKGFKANFQMNGNYHSVADPGFFKTGSRF
ncbi:Dorsal-ventral patterning tolloid-like protein 1 [Exaiptasia diaphana]|nr:Dorsal-ventral patterning tolloid-like protein 1 [Exaiptasia diaphana]